MRLRVFLKTCDVRIPKFIYFEGFSYRSRTREENLCIWQTIEKFHPFRMIHRDKST